MHNRITALGLSVKVWTSLPVAVLLRSAIWEANSKTLPRSMSFRKLSMQVHDHYRLELLEGVGAILACTMKEMKHVALMLAAHSVLQFLRYQVICYTFGSMEWNVSNVRATCGFQPR